MLTFFISTLFQKSFAGGYLILWRLLAGSMNRFSRPEAADVYLDKWDAASPADWVHGAMNVLEQNSWYFYTVSVDDEILWSKTQ